MGLCAIIVRLASEAPNRSLNLVSLLLLLFWRARLARANDSLVACMLLLLRLLPLSAKRTLRPLANSCCCCYDLEWSTQLVDVCCLLCAASLMQSLARRLSCALTRVRSHC